MRSISFKQFVIENENKRLEWLETNFKTKLMQAGFVRTDAQWRDIVAADPTIKKVYLQWIINLILKKNVRMDDLDKVNEDLANFEKIKHKIPADMRDINKYRQYQDLYDVVKKNNIGDHSSLDELLEYYKKEITLVYKGPEGVCLCPLTRNAAVAIGKHTRWCTSRPENSFFADYTKNGKKLYIFITKENEYFQAEGAAHLTAEQYHNSEDPEQFVKAFTSGQIADRDDRMIEISHPFFKSGIFWKAAKQAIFAANLIGIAVKFKSPEMFRAATASNIELLRAIKADVPDILEMEKSGALRRYRDVLNMYKFVDANFQG